MFGKAKKILLLSAVATIFCGIIVFAETNTTEHFLGYNSVDSGEIRWGGTTKYTTERDFAINLWNEYSSNVKIAPDTSLTYQDLTFQDSYKSSETWTGVYTYYGPLTDTITFNSYYFDKPERQGAYNKKTAAHELGHALGIGDHYEDHTGYNNFIMNGYSSTTNTLHQHDKDDYDIVS